MFGTVQALAAATTNTPSKSDWLSAGAAVLSLGVSAMAWFLARRALQATHAYAYIPLQSGIDQALIEHPECVKYFYNSAAVDECNRDQATAIAYAYLSELDAIASIIRSIRPRRDRKAWKEFIRIAPERSPLTKSTYQGHHDRDKWWPNLSKYGW
jgi:hypothetical protein